MRNLRNFCPQNYLAAGRRNRWTCSYQNWPRNALRPSLSYRPPGRICLAASRFRTMTKTEYSASVAQSSTFAPALVIDRPKFWKRFCNAQEVSQIEGGILRFQIWSRRVWPPYSKRFQGEAPRSQGPLPDKQPTMFCTGLQHQLPHQKSIVVRCVRRKKLQEEGKTTSGANKDGHSRLI